MLPKLEIHHKMEFNVSVDAVNPFCNILLMAPPNLPMLHNILRVNKPTLLFLPPPAMLKLEVTPKISAIFYCQCETNHMYISCR